MTTASMDTASATQMDTKPHPQWRMIIGGFAALVIGAIMLWGTAITKVNTYALLVTMLGLWWLVAGILDIVHIFTDKTAWGWKLFMGIVSILAGGAILTYPVASALALPKIFVFVLGLWGIFYGIILLINAFRGAGWGAGILGVLALVFGGAILANYQDFGMGLAMVWAASVWAVIGGIILIVRGFQARKA
ncbi:MAG TPA: DUF308 domain-containing protein [Anaerolineales bacterium]|nr:DUF308 domain-containing protein [Anaerolineales bacterium]